MSTTPLSIRWQGVESPEPQSGIAPASEAKGASFTDALEGAITSVSEAQTSADAQSAKLANGGGNLHETALALEKADVEMRLLTKVRNKVVDAYAEVMRMSV